MPWDMVRAVPAIRRSPVDFLTATAARYGDLAAFPLPRTPVLLLNDPAGVKHVLVDAHRRYGRATPQYSALATVTGQGLLASDGDTWRRHRRTVQPAFHHGALSDVAERAVAAGARLGAEADARAGAPLEVLDATSRASLEVVGHTLADADLSGVAQQLVDAVGRALELLVARAASPVPGSWPTRSRRLLERETARIDAVCARIVAARRARPAAADGDEREDGREDVVGLMLRAGLSDAEVRDELVTFVVAGHETVASSLTWTLDLLARHPGAQQRLHAELDELLDGGRRSPGWEDLRGLRFTRAVLEESLRLYPPAWVITRRALEDDVVAGVEVPAGTLVIVCTWALHRHPAVWEEPEEFRPERFLDAARRERGYVPFGAGPRLCIGRDLALVESVLLLAELLRTRSLAPAPGPRPAVESLVTLRPRGGLHLLVRDRDGFRPGGTAASR
ncbi:cytochrome P450 [Kineococcus sp. SYSU DK004]|uniref:cytochrome P450 n=1 Tax=Kineococcus sp. SYSU DK004 TaxID=3383125 RepID=UPI003D7DA144